MTISIIISLERMRVRVLFNAIMKYIKCEKRQKTPSMETEKKALPCTHPFINKKKNLNGCFNLRRAAL